uniref:Uncharacterized protein n=1 Tax=Mesocestoides corti TaxID=53468 RepID=A0A5K3EGI0_MESCO
MDTLASSSEEALRLSIHPIWLQAHPSCHPHSHWCLETCRDGILCPRFQLPRIWLMSKLDTVLIKSMKMKWNMRPNTRN